MELSIEAPTEIGGMRIYRRHPPAFPPKARVFLIHKCPIFARRMAQVATALGIYFKSFGPGEFDAFPADDEFDAGIIAFELGDINGAQVSSLFPETPVLLLVPEATFHLEQVAAAPFVQGIAATGARPESLLTRALGLRRHTPVAIGDNEWRNA